MLGDLVDVDPLEEFLQGDEAGGGRPGLRSRRQCQSRSVGVDDIVDEDVAKSGVILGDGSRCFNGQL